MDFTAALIHYSRLLRDVEPIRAVTVALEGRTALTSPRRFKPARDRMAKSRSAARQRRIHHFSRRLRESKVAGATPPSVDLMMFPVDTGEELER